MNTRNIFFTLSFAVCSFIQMYPKQQKKIKHRRSRKPRVRSQYATFKTMTYEQLCVVKDEQLKTKSWTIAIKFLKRMLTLCTDVRKLADHFIELADALYENGNYSQAVKVYREFTQMYPGNKKIEYALYRAVVASWNCTHTPDRDQTSTHETINLTDIFLAQSDLFKTYTQEVEQIRTECYQKLIASELNICSFYRDRGDLEVVETRLTLIDTEWGTTFAPTKHMIQAFRDIDTDTSHDQINQTAPLLVTENKKTKAADRF